VHGDGLRGAGHSPDDEDGAMNDLREQLSLALRVSSATVLSLSLDFIF